jgi:transcriptional regulator with XRE-family HTH domain
MTRTELTKEQNECVRREVLELRERYGTMAKLARVLRVSQPLISQVLSGKTGAGWKLLNSIARLTRKTTDEIIGKQATNLDVEIDALKYENRELTAERDKLRDALCALAREAAELGAKCQKIVKATC